MIQDGSEQATAFLLGLMVGAAGMVVVWLANERVPPAPPATRPELLGDEATELGIVPTKTNRRER